MQQQARNAIIFVAAYAISTGASAHLDSENHTHTHTQSYGDWLLTMLSGDNLSAVLLVGGIPVAIAVAYGWRQQRRQRAKQERNDDAR